MASNADPKAAINARGPGLFFDGLPPIPVKPAGECNENDISTRFLTMSRAEEIYLKLSAAVLKMRAAREVARRRADENEKLPESLRQPGRSEYIQVLQELQATGQSVLDDTPEADDQPLQTQGRAGRFPTT